MWAVIITMLFGGIIVTYSVRMLRPTSEDIIATSNNMSLTDETLEELAEIYIADNVYETLLMPFDVFVDLFTEGRWNGQHRVRSIS